MCKQVLGSGALSIAMLASVVGCDSCERDRPYTPFGVASTFGVKADAAPAASVSTGPSAQGSFQARKSIAAPLGTRRWQLGDHSYSAPPDRVFSNGIVADFDQDDETELAAWVVPVVGKPMLPRGELWLIPTEGKPRKLAALPGFVPTGPNCELSTELTHTGPRTLTVDSRAECTGNLLARSPVRAVSVVAPSSEEPLVLGLRVAAPAPGETLELAVDSSDRDDDGQDDVKLQLSVGREGTEAVSVPFVWLDRTAGPSRQTGEPEETLEKLASLAQVRSTGQRTSLQALQTVDNARRLIASGCAEAGTPRLFDREGTPLRCGDFGLTNRRLTTAEVRAWLTQQRVLDAVSALARDGWYIQALPEDARKKLNDEVKKALNVLQPSSVKRLMVEPMDPPGPNYSALRFEPDGSLLVQTLAGMRRIPKDSVRAEQLEVDATVPSWALAVERPDGARWLGASHSCNRSELVLSFVGPRGAPLDPVPTRLLARRPGPCEGKAAPTNPQMAPLGIVDAQLHAIVASAPVGLGLDASNPPPKAKAPGSPRSQAGGHIVVPGPLGLLVDSATPALWELTEHELEPTDLRDCIINDDGDAIACISDGSAWLLQR